MRARKNLRRRCCGQSRYPLVMKKAQFGGAEVGLTPQPKWRNGRRDGLKIRCPKGRVGSNPTLGTWDADYWSENSGMSLLACANSKRNSVSPRSSSQFLPTRHMKRVCGPWFLRRLIQPLNIRMLSATRMLLASHGTRSRATSPNSRRNKMIFSTDSQSSPHKTEIMKR